MSNGNIFPAVLSFTLLLTVLTCRSLMYVWNSPFNVPQFLILFALSLSRSHLLLRKMNLQFKASRIWAVLVGGKCQRVCLNDYWQKDLWSRKQFKKKRAILLSLRVAEWPWQSAIITKHESMNMPYKQTNNSMRFVKSFTVIKPTKRCLNWTDTQSNHFLCVKASFTIAIANSYR